MLEVDPFDDHARFRLSQILIAEDRDLTVAERLVKSIMNKDKGRKKEGDNDKDEDKEHKSQKFMPAECYELLGDIEYSEKNKRYTKAVEYYHRSNELKANNVNIYIKLGKAFEKLREFDEAIAFLKKALRRDKNNFLAHYRLALCYIRNNMRQEGIESLKKAHAVNPSDVETMLKLSEIYLRDDSKLVEAEQMTKKILAIGEQNTLAEATLNLGRVLEKQGKNDEALVQFKKGLELSQTKTQDKQDAQKQLRQAHFHIGCQYERIKEFKNSIYHFKQCLLYDQSHFGACIHLATQLANSGDFDKAQKYFKHCIKLNPTSVPAHFGLGKILH